jgi:hypothetical protein
VIGFFAKVFAYHNASSTPSLTASVVAPLLLCRHLPPLLVA